MRLIREKLRGIPQKIEEILQTDSNVGDNCDMT